MTQGNAVRDYVFPLVRATKNRHGIYEYGELIGTGFFIGNEGYALTAGHVIDQLFDGLPEHGVALALFAEYGGWRPFEIKLHEKHSTQDVGIIYIPGNWQSIIMINDFPQNSSAKYFCWGYPKVVAQEISRVQEGSKERPELIYTEGYIRRRISNELESIIYKGDQFYELSEIVGEGNSGGPVLLNESKGQERWQLIGVYIGEKAGQSMDVSYAVRTEAFSGWVPSILTTSIKKHAS